MMVNKCDEFWLLKEINSSRNFKKVKISIYVIGLDKFCSIKSMSLHITLKTVLLGLSLLRYVLEDDIHQLE